jgi:hypothetical protein
MPPWQRSREQILQHDLIANRDAVGAAQRDGRLDRPRGDDRVAVERGQRVALRAAA